MLCQTGVGTTLHTQRVNEGSAGLCTQHTRGIVIELVPAVTHVHVAIKVCLVLRSDIRRVERGHPSTLVGHQPRKRRDDLTNHRQCAVGGRCGVTGGGRRIDVIRDGAKEERLELRAEWYDLFGSPSGQHDLAPAPTPVANGCIYP